MFNSYYTRNTQAQTTVKDNDGTLCKIGDEVDFKQDIEGQGTILAIDGDTIVVKIATCDSHPHAFFSTKFNCWTVGGVWNFSKA